MIYPGRYSNAEELCTFLYDYHEVSSTDIALISLKESLTQAHSLTNPYIRFERLREVLADFEHVLSVDLAEFGEPMETEDWWEYFTEALYDSLAGESSWFVAGSMADRIVDVMFSMTPGQILAMDSTDVFPLIEKVTPMPGDWLVVVDALDRCDVLYSERVAEMNMTRSQDAGDANDIEPRGGEPPQRGLAYLLPDEILHEFVSYMRESTEATLRQNVNTAGAV